MKDFRTRINRFQFISQFGFDKERFALGINVMYLPGMDTEVDQERLFIEGFWSIEVDLIFVTLTLNITDKP